jgi:hypothetical protein
MAVNSEGRNEGFRPAVSDGAIEVVGYDQLGAALGFAETFVQPAESVLPENVEREFERVTQAVFGPSPCRSFSQPTLL